MSKTSSAKTAAEPKTASAPGDGSIPIWVILGVYLAVTFLIFSEFIFGGEMLFGGDTESLGYMARAFYADELRDGNFPMWNPLLLGGTPFLESLAGGDSLYPLSAPLLLLMEPFRSLGWKLVLHVFIGGLGMYGWTRSIGASKPAAFLGGLGYLVAPFMVTLVYPGHDGKIFVTALTPFLFWAVESYFMAGKGRAWAATAGVIALVTLTTHFQMAYFLFLATGAYAAFRTVQYIRDPSRMQVDGDPSPPRAVGRFGLFLVASVIGVGAASIQFLPAVDYIQSDSRRAATTTEASAEENKAYAASWSMHPEEALSLVVPEFVGGNAGNAFAAASGGPEWLSSTYWGRNAFKLNHEYIGLVLMILAGLSFFGAARKGLRWFMFGLFVVSLGYTLGAISPIWHLMYAVLPGVDLFRAASMVIFLSGFAVCTLAALGIDMLLGWARGDEEAGTGAQRWLWGSAAAMGLFLVLSSTGVLYGIWEGLFFGSFEENQAAALELAKPFITRGAFIALILAAATAGLGLLAKKRVLATVPLVTALAILITFDGVRVDLGFIQTRDWEEFTQTDPLTDELIRRQGEETPFRVFDFSDQSSETVRRAMFGLELTGGHHPNDVGRYRELVGKVGGGAPQNFLSSANVPRLTNTRYMIWPAWRLGGAEQYAEQFPGLSGIEAVTATQMQDGSLYDVLYRFDDLPRARLVSQVEVVEPDAVVDRLLSDAFDPETAIVMAEAPPRELGGGSPAGSVEWLDRGTERAELRVTSDRAAILVIANNWVDAWSATVNGEEVPVLRVNHTQIGIPVQGGTQDVLLTFESWPVATGLWLSAICIVLLGAVTSVSWYRQNPPAPRPAEQGVPRA